MKIETIRPFAGPASAKKTGASHGKGFAAELHPTSKEKVAVTGLHVTSPVFAAQLEETPDLLEKRQRRRMLERGSLILDQLEEVRLGLLMGEISPQEIDKLLRVLQTQKSQLQDIKLLNLLEEIEIRAKVELAKLAPRK